MKVDIPLNYHLIEREKKPYYEVTLTFAHGRAVDEFTEEVSKFYDKDAMMRLLIFLDIYQRYDYDGRNRFYSKEKANAANRLAKQKYVEYMQKFFGYMDIDILAREYEDMNDNIPYDSVLDYCRAELIAISVVYHDNNDSYVVSYAIPEIEENDKYK